ncbi:DUF6993 domain-containing protein [Microbacterium sp.]|uniref:DUF6993 domain-containing protein n=1 Tax=Microbacterium sp. TaxID=51671 RepID=UPI0039E3EB6D
MPRGPSVAPLGLVALMVAGALAGCTGGPAKPAKTAPASPPVATAEPATLVPDGTAEDNLPLFAQTVTSVAATGSVEGRAYVDALVAAGFERAAMQVTPDRTSVDDPADSIQFSVLWRDEQCLVGQVGPSTPTPTAVVLPKLPDGGCLVGRTRPIDW